MKRIIALFLCVLLSPLCSLAEQESLSTQSLPTPTESTNMQRSAALAPDSQPQPEQLPSTERIDSQPPSELQAQPAEPRYQVELLVFRFVDAQPLLDDWQIPAMVNTNEAVDLVLPDVAIQQILPNYCLLPHDRFILKREQQNLSHQKDYQILLHIAWTQALTDKWHSKPVHVSGGKNFSISGEFANEVDGTVSLSIVKFLTFKSDLFFTEPSSSLDFKSASMGQAFTKLPNLLSYHLNASRRMKMGELNYLDNPNFGVLVKVIPIDNA